MFRGLNTASRAAVIVAISLSPSALAMPTSACKTSRSPQLRSRRNLISRSCNQKADGRRQPI